MVVALKSRTIAAAEAVRAVARRGAGAARAAGRAGCSSNTARPSIRTDAGNIGPVIEALLDSARQAPSPSRARRFPPAGRTVYRGLPVRQRRAAERKPDEGSSADADARRQPGARAAAADRAAGRPRRHARPWQRARPRFAPRSRPARRRTASSSSTRITDEDLRAIGAALAQLPLITGGSGVAIGLPRGLSRGRPARRVDGGAAAAASRRTGRRAILAGSCSAATRAQVKAAIAAGLPHSARRSAGDRERHPDRARRSLDWIDRQPRSDRRPFLVYSSDDPDAVAGGAGSGSAAPQAGTIVEDRSARWRAALPRRGITQLIVAGGETSGAVMQALGVARADASGRRSIPACRGRGSRGGADMALALKSGNFGTRGFLPQRVATGWRERHEQ